MNIPVNTRRYDLDWLRIIAFGLLIFYHIGMFYVTWGWHVKSVHAGAFAQPAMSLLNPWRLALLFFISGVALRFASDKAHLGRFAWQRSWRLFIPIIFGMHVIVAPQAWLQLLESGEITSGFWQFYPEYLWGSTSRYSITIPTWNHLWYIVYLFIYTLLLVPFIRPLSRFMAGRGAKLTTKIFANRWNVLLIPFIPHMIYRVCLDPYFPTTHDVVSDWANHAHSFTILLTGFLLAKDIAFWSAISRVFKPLVIMTVSLAAVLSVAWYNWSWVETHEIWLWPARVGRVLYAWFAIAVLLGAAQRWLNRPSRTLTYMTEAIFPWYILHQTLTVMAGYWLTRQGLNVGAEFALVTLATFGGCLVIHEVFIRRFNLIRPLFGLKRLAPETMPHNKPLDSPKTV